MARHSIEADGRKALRPIPLVRITTDEVDAANRLFAFAAPVPVALGDAKLLLKLGRAPVPEEDAPWVGFTLGGDAAAVQVPWDILARVAGLPLEGGLSADQALLVEDALSGWLGALEREGWPSFRITAIGARRAELPILAGLDVRGADDGGQFFERLAPLALSLAAARRLGETLAPHRATGDCGASVPVPVDIVIGQIRVAVEALPGIVPGAGLPLPLEGRPLAMLPGGLSAPVCVTPVGLEITGAFCPPPTKLYGDQIMDTPQPALDEASAEAVPVTLSFHAGQTQISLKELQALAPGAVLASHAPADTSVEIRANGQRIGMGELLALETGRVVRITSLD